MMIGVLCTSTYSMRPHRTSIDYIMLSKEMAIYCAEERDIKTN